MFVRCRYTSIGSKKPVHCVFLCCVRVLSLYTRVSEVIDINIIVGRYTVQCGREQLE